MAAGTRNVKKRTNMKGIARKWMISSVGVIFLILVALIAILSFTVRGSIYSGIQATLDGRSSELTNVFSDYTLR